MNARFWTFANGSLVKITLRPGEELEWSQGGPTDEGWSAEGELVRLEDGVVSSVCWSDGRDCDGRLYSERRAEWPVGGPVRLVEGVAIPDWRLVGRGQRDYAAEAAGY